MSDWKPIETAPKDGTKILIALESDVYIGYYEGDYVYCWSFLDYDPDGHEIAAHKDNVKKLDADSKITRRY